MTPLIVRLTRADYDTLRQMNAHADQIEAESIWRAKRQAWELKQQVRAAKVTLAQTYEALAVQYGFDPTLVYTFDDQAGALIAYPPGGP